MDEDDEFGCCFPDRCLMPGEHLKSECHDVAIMEALARKYEGPTVRAVETEFGPGIEIETDQDTYRLCWTPPECPHLAPGILIIDGGEARPIEPSFEMEAIWDVLAFKAGLR